ncbi:DUF63 family protein [Candidatus Micrarchaeota archaeon]|nr:DUF63 family protein [Candidatus Micrarchaeota archaeon]
MASDIIQTYFIDPIWQRSGYNTINTVVYAVIALVAAYAIFKLLRTLRIRIDEKFVLYIMPFILFGSTLRVLTDITDRGMIGGYRDYLFGLMGTIIDSHVYDYSYFTVTPGIYIVVGLLTLASVIFFHKIKRFDLLPWFGTVLWLSQLILLIPAFKFYSYGILVLALALVGLGTGLVVLKHIKAKSYFPSIVVFSHSLDGAATYVVLNVFSSLENKQFFEQHVLSRGIGDVGEAVFGPGNGMLLFFLVKVAFATLATVVLEKEENAEEKNYVVLLLSIFGLAPGVRDLLTMVAST